MVMRREVIGNATLYCSDWREGYWRDVACMLTDPPYGDDYKSGYATPDLWLVEQIPGDKDLRERNEAVIAFSGVPQLVFGKRQKELPPLCRAVLVWDKGPALGMGALDIPWKPSYEEIYVIGKGFVGRRDEGAVLYCPPVQSMAKNGRVHPNEKPVGLMRRLLRKLPAGPVADPFMGSGSVGVAATLEGRPYIGAEIVPAYFDIACRRIEEAQRQRDLFVDAPVPTHPVETQIADLFAEVSD